MAGPRIFTSFAIEDENLKTLFISQKRNSQTPFDYTDYSVKSAWATSWKTNCRARISGCDGLIGIITRNTPNADGQIWEIECSIAENIPTLLLYGSESARGVRLPGSLGNKRIFSWSWPIIEAFVKRVS